MSNSKNRETLCSKGVWGFEVQKLETDIGDGLEIISVTLGSVMAKAGVKKGDRILSLNYIWTDSLEDLFTPPANPLPINNQSSRFYATMK